MTRPRKAVPRHAPPPRVFTTFYTSLLPLHYVTNVLGLGMLKYTNAGNLVVSRFGIVYSLTMGVLFFGCFVFAVEDIRIISKASDNSISAATEWVDLYASICIQTSSIIINCIQSTKLIKFYKEVGIIDAQMKTVGENPDYGASFKFVTVGMAAILAEFIYVFGTDYALFIQDESKFYLVASYYPIISNGLVKLQMGTTVFLVWRRFRWVNDVLRRVEAVSTLNTMEVVKVTVNFKQKAGQLRVGIIKVCHKIHNDLCRLIVTINQLYGVQTVMFAGNVFAITVSEVYYCYTQAKESEISTAVLVDICFSLQWALIQLLEMSVIVYLCERTQTEIHNTNFNLHSILHNSQADKQLKHVVERFSLHLMQTNSQFSAGGLFSLNYSLIHSMLASIASYTIIMIQFDIAKNSNLSTTEPEIINSTA